MHTVETRHSFPHLGGTTLTALTKYFLHLKSYNGTKNMIYDRQLKQGTLSLVTLDHMVYIFI